MEDCTTVVNMRASKELDIIRDLLSIFTNDIDELYSHGWIKSSGKICIYRNNCKGYVTMTFEWMNTYGSTLKIRCFLFRKRSSALVEDTTDVKRHLLSNAWNIRTQPNRHFSKFSFARTVMIRRLFDIQVAFFTGDHVFSQMVHGWHWLIERMNERTSGCRRWTNIRSDNNVIAWQKCAQLAHHARDRSKSGNDVSCANSLAE
jgi:hypothetical protein